MAIVATKPWSLRAVVPDVSFIGWDFDGTLVHSQRAQVESWRVAFERLLPAEVRERVQAVVRHRHESGRFFGMSAEIFGLLEAAAALPPELSCPEQVDGWVAEARAEAMLSLARGGQLRLDPGARALSLGLASVPQAICTSNPRALAPTVDQVLGDLGALMTVRIFGEDTPPKPDPACWREAARRLGVGWHRAIIIEDNLEVIERLRDEGEVALVIGIAGGESVDSYLGELGAADDGVILVDGLRDVRS